MKTHSDMLLLLLSVCILFMVRSAWTAAIPGRRAHGLPTQELASRRAPTPRVAR